MAGIGNEEKVLCFVEKGSMYGYGVISLKIYE